MVRLTGEAGGGQRHAAPGPGYHAGRPGLVEWGTTKSDAAGEKAGGPSFSAVTKEHFRAIARRKPWGVPHLPNGIRRIIHFSDLHGLIYHSNEG